MEKRQFVFQLEESFAQFGLEIAKIQPAEKIAKLQLEKRFAELSQRIAELHLGRMFAELQLEKQFAELGRTLGELKLGDEIAKLGTICRTTPRCYCCRCGTPCSWRVGTDDESPFWEAGIMTIRKDASFDPCT